MHPVFTQQLALEHIVELRRQAARQRLARELRARPATGVRRRRLWKRLRLRQPRPAMG